MKCFSLVILSILPLFMYAGALTVSDQGVIDFGDFPANRSMEHVFVVTNASDQAIALKGIRSTCSCLTGEFTPGLLAPQESVNLPVSIRANSESGPFERLIYLETGEPGRRFIPMKIRGNAVPLIRVTPDRNRYTGQLESGKVHAFTFELHSDNPAVKLTLNDKTTYADLRWEKRAGALEFKLPADHPAGAFDYTVECVIMEPTGWPPLLFHLRGHIGD